MPEGQLARVAGAPSARTAEGANRRAADRFARLVAAGRMLVRESGSTDFGVPEVAKRAHTSLRAFYEFFANRDELLLAVFGDFITEATVYVRAAVEVYDKPIAQLQAYVHTLFLGAFAHSRAEARAMVTLHLRLVHENPSALAEILEQQNGPLADILHLGVADGTFRDDIEVGALAMILSQTVLAAVHTAAIGSQLVNYEVGVEDVWAYCLGGVARS